MQGGCDNLSNEVIITLQGRTTPVVKCRLYYTCKKIECFVFAAWAGAQHKCDPVYHVTLLSSVKSFLTSISAFTPGTATNVNMLLFIKATKISPRLGGAIQKHKRQLDDQLHLTSNGSWAPKCPLCFDKSPSNIPKLSLCNNLSLT